MEYNDTPKHTVRPTLIMSFGHPLYATYNVGVIEGSSEDSSLSSGSGSEYEEALR
jgi:hypothetical protein